MCRLWLFLFLAVLFCGLLHDTTVDAQYTGRIRCHTQALYSTIDGRCNNLRHPRWGAGGEPYLRVLSPHYEDGRDFPRLRQKDDDPLPSPRLVSTKVHAFMSSPFRNATVYAMAWGQFIVHDMALTPTEKKRVIFPCCDNAVVSAYRAHPWVANRGVCFPIIVPEGDRHFTNLSTRCIGLVRSSPKYDYMGVRQQFNKLSAYIDGTTIYGSDKAEMMKLRTFTKGKMRETKEHNLPLSKTNKCIKKVQTDYCLEAGDIRVNVYPTLAALHTIFLRYHNLVAGHLASSHQRYDDEKIFQEARKIVNAVMQHITYKEYLPSVLGQTYIEKYKLADRWIYRRNVNPTIFNSFTTAAFRFGHSMVTDSLLLKGKEEMNIDMYHRPFFVLHGRLPDVLTSAASRDCEKSDKLFSRGMTDHLFEEAPQKGKDIVSINIQRGRDHGLPSYNAFRKFCGLPPHTNFSQMASGHLFKSVYKHVDDVDLYSGGVAEKPVDGAVGPTFSCLIGLQFHRVRAGDRFWYENTKTKQGFKSSLLTELQKTKLSHVICLTTNVTQIQEDVFLPVNNNTNPVISCSTIKKNAMNLIWF